MARLLRTIFEAALIGLLFVATMLMIWTVGWWLMTSIMRLLTVPEVEDVLEIIGWTIASMFCGGLAALILAWIIKRASQWLGDGASSA